MKAKDDLRMIETIKFTDADGRDLAGKQVRVMYGRSIHDSLIISISADPHADGDQWNMFTEEIFTPSIEKVMMNSASSQEIYKEEVRDCIRRCAREYFKARYWWEFKKEAADLFACYMFGIPFLALTLFIPSTYGGFLLAMLVAIASVYWYKLMNKLGWNAPVVRTFESLLGVE